MGVPFKKIARKDPRKADAVAKFYPQLVTLGDNATLDDIAYVMKEKSSLTLGDIQSVLTNFVEAMITTLYSGQSVNIKNFGVFSLSARTAGVLDVKECQEHQSGENQFPAFQHRKTGHRRHACRAED